ncbi:MAG TPA: penicillin-binding transpeptidase domain-containing protein [Gemmatimonadaceae bacterium]|nr:penicillin-binding transpeptidase domain-containing protein [Gemmatimonadaceae bacterium]
MTTPKRVAIIHAVFLLFALALTARAAKVQVADGKQWVARAKRQHYFASAQSAPRGDILDASGNTLVQSQELTRVAVALPEVRDTAFVVRALRRAKIDAEVLHAAISRRRRWIELPGLYSSADVASLSKLNGIHLTPVLQRVYAKSVGIQRIVGALDNRGNPVTGLELALDTVLRGDSGSVRLARDKSGRPLDTPDAWSEDAKPGATVVLTINNTLQDICERQLAIAVDSLHANGGDIVMMNPHTGEILALASRRIGTSSLANTAVTEPFEPGSTLKPFVAAALLEKGRAKPTDIVSTHNGKLELDGRVITDMHKAAQLSLADVIRYSSNIGIVEFGQRLTPRQKYETFRDLGFGMQLGVPLPAESPGTLREPRFWSKQTPASILMGYEIAVTPLQLVTAYAAIANGGELMEPHLVKEVRSNAGKVMYKAEPRAIRRVMSGETAHTVQQMMRAVVEQGTATKADLATFEVAGKSGTARRTSTNLGYTTGNYTASFVGLFPAQDPQYVVLVKLDSPQGAHYAGGDIAAPVTQVVLRAALAARDAALDRQDLAVAEKPPPQDSAAAAGQSVAVERSSANVRRQSSQVSSATYDPNENLGSVADQPLPPVVVDLPSTLHAAPAPSALRAVPDVRGLSVRAAVKTLHQAGFRVRLVEAPATFTLPAAGAMAAPGTLVQLAHSRE